MSNTAELQFDVDGAGQTVSSNTVRIILAERLDVTVVADAPTRLADSIGEETAVGFRVANDGNGAEVFTLAAKAAGEGASVLRIVADDDGNGVYDPAIDRQLTSLQLPLDAGQGAHLFVIVGGFQSQADISLSATAATGSGAPGTLFNAKGQGGSDAIVGATGATATGNTLLTVRSQVASLFKSQTVASPDGGTRAVRGATITYTLEARFAEATAAVEIADPIPEGTAYVAGSLVLDGARLSDAVDADAGRFDAGQSARGAVKVALGNVAAGNRTIRFQVTIQ